MVTAFLGNIVDRTPRNVNLPLVWASRSNSGMAPQDSARPRVCGRTSSTSAADPSEFAGHCSYQIFM